MTTTYRTMDVSDLGDNATADDLTAFRKACERKQEATGWDDATVTDWMWNGGDWTTTVTGMGF
jgi:hypothetical protein